MSIEEGDRAENIDGVEERGTNFVPLLHLQGSITLDDDREANRRR